MSRRSASHSRWVASKTAGEPVGGGLVGADEAKVVVVAGDHVSQKRSRACGSPTHGRGRDSSPRPRSRGSRAAAARAAAGRRWRGGWRSSAARRPGPARPARGPALRARRTAPRAGMSASTVRAREGARGSRGRLAAAPDERARCPRPAAPSTSFGPVQPFGVRSTIIGQRGRSLAPPARAARRISSISVTACSIAVASRGWIAAGVLAVDAAGDEDRPVAVSGQQLGQLSLGYPRQAGSGWRSCSR